MKKFLESALVSFVCALVILCVPSVASAATLDVKGTAEVLSTGNTFTFGDHNSDVTVDPATGDFTGRVWSEDLGWIDFDNNGDGDAVKVNLTTGKLSGQAYTLNTGARLHFTNYNSNVEMDLKTGGISGYAWSEDVGWVNFSTAKVSQGLLPLGNTGQNVLSFMLMSLGFLGSGVYLVKRRPFKRS